MTPKFFYSPSNLNENFYSKYTKLKNCSLFFPLMFIVAASSLHHAIQTLPKNSRKRLNTYVLAIPGATLQTFVRNRNKSLSFLLQYPLRKSENIILWHDIINNTISQHKSNFYKPWSPQELIGSVLKIKHRLSAIIYCQRIGAQTFSNNYGQLGYL